MSSWMPPALIMPRACEPPLQKGPNRGKTATGTVAGYDRHRTARESPCDACQAAAAGEPPPVEKLCPRCKTIRSASEFHRNKRSFDGLHSWCKPCRSETGTEFHRKNRHLIDKEVVLDKHLRRNYGITLVQYNEMLAQQNGVCAICQRPCRTGYRLAVDHHHGTGRVRGLLCVSCNTSLGGMSESPELITRLLNYAKSWEHLNAADQ